jgi:hypothetical protein
MRHVLALLLLLLVAACGGPKRTSVSELSPEAQTEQPRANTQKEPERPKEPEKPKDPPKKVWTKKVVITTGVHGNEPSGYLVQDKLTELGFVTYGPCNEWGIKNNKREMQDGRDLNRLFQDGGVPQVKAVWEFLAANKPDLLLDLHEDPTGNAKGPYLIQNGPKDDLGEKIIEALKEYNWDPEPAWGPIKGKNGLIKPTAQMLALQKLANVFSLGSYAFFTYKVTTFTVEVPGGWEMEKKKEYQLRVCQAAREIFEARATSNERK